jgi:hypothetical protein
MILSVGAIKNIDSKHFNTKWNNVKTQEAIKTKNY